MILVESAQDCERSCYCCHCYIQNHRILHLLRKILHRTSISVYQRLKDDRLLQDPNSKSMQTLNPPVKLSLKKEKMHIDHFFLSPLDKMSKAPYPKAISCPYLPYVVEVASPQALSASLPHASPRKVRAACGDHCAYWAPRFVQARILARIRGMTRLIRPSGDLRLAIALADWLD